MKVYKNPFVSRPYYFVPTGVARTGRCEASARTGYSVEFWDGKWVVNKVRFYDCDLKKELPVVAENNLSIQAVINRAVLDAVLDAVCDANKDHYEEVR